MKKKSILVIFAGLPGTGKTTLCKLLEKKIKCKFFDSDYYAKKTGLYRKFKKIKSEKESKELREKFYDKKVKEIEKLLKKNNVVTFDAVFDKEKLRIKFYRMTKKINAKLIIIVATAPSKVVIQRIRNDTKHFSQRPGEKPTGRINTYKTMKKDWEPLKKEHYIIDSTKDINPQLNRILIKENLK